MLVLVGYPLVVAVLIAITLQSNGRDYSIALVNLDDSGRTVRVGDERLSVDDHHYRVAVQDDVHRLDISAARSEGGLLHAPYDQRMIERVAETMTSRLDIRLQRVSDGSVLYAGTGGHGCLEVQGDLEAVLHE